MERPVAAQRRLQRGRRPARRSEYGFEPTRFDEMRRGAWDVNAASPTWTSTASGHRSASRRSSRASSASGSRSGPTTTSSPRRDARVQRLASRRVVRRASRSVRPESDPVAARSRDRGRRDPAQRRARIQGGDLLRSADNSGSVAPFRLLGSVLRRVRGDRDRVCLHVGSSGTSPTTSPDAPPEIAGVLFVAYGMYSAVDWLYSKVPVRFPDIQDLPVRRRHRLGGRADRPPRPLLPLPARLPADLARRRPSPSESCAATSGSARSTTTSGMLVPRSIGVEHILVESDYPHADSSWPDTQACSSGSSRPGFPRRRAPHQLAERRRSCSATRFPTPSGGDRHPRCARRASRPRTSRRARVHRGGVGPAITWREYDESSSQMAATLAAVYEPGDRVALQLRDGPAAHARCSPARRPDSSRSVSAPRRRREVTTSWSEPAPGRCSPPSLRRETAAAATVRRARPVVPQLHVGDDRPAEDRDARPGALVRVPRFRAAHRGLHS